SRTPAPVLAAAPSAELRDQLLAELATMAGSDALAEWAHLRLPAKNTLGVTDAQRIDMAFRDKLAAVDVENPEEGPIDAPETAERPDAIAQTAAVTPSPVADPPPARPRQTPAKTIRLRDKDHRRFVSTQPCLVCGRSPADPHHLRFAQPRAMSRKVSDEFTV